jgi:hypothetical protein
MVMVMVMVMVMHCAARNAYPPFANRKKIAASTSVEGFRLHGRMRGSRNPRGVFAEYLASQLQLHSIGYFKARTTTTQAPICIDIMPAEQMWCHFA